MTASICAAGLLLAGCGSAQSAAERLDGNGKPLVKVMMKIDQTAPTEPGGTAWGRKLEEACGCTIQWETIIDQTDQKAAMLASGEVPDVAISIFKSTETQQYPYFEDLSDDLDKMPNVKAMLTEDPTTKLSSENMDGKIYSLANDLGYEPSTWKAHLMVNKTWLDRLGLNMPTTMDELRDVLEAFKTRDPNGNGKADEIPFLFNKLQAKSFAFAGPYMLLGAYGINTQAQSNAYKNGIYVKDGKVRSFVIEEAYKDLTKFYHDLLAKGYSPADTLTKDSSAVSSLMAGTDVALVGIGMGVSNTAFGQHADEYVGMPVPQAGSEKAVWETRAEKTAVSPGKVAVWSDAPNKEAVFKLVDALYDPDQSVQGIYGDIPEYVSKDGGNEYTVKDAAYNDQMKIVGGFGTDNAPGWVRPESKIGGKAAEYWGSAIATFKAFDQQRANVGADDIMPSWVSADEADMTTISNNNAQIMNQVQTQTSKWIKDGNIDAEWDQYVANVKSLGLDQNIELWQKWYDIYKNAGMLVSER